MSKLTKTITNELEIKRFELEDKLEKIVSSEKNMETKKVEAIETLKEFALYEISSNLWKMYTTPSPEAPAEEQKRPEAPAEGQKQQ